MFSLYTMSIRCNSEGIGSIIRRTDDQTLQTVLDDTFFYASQGAHHWWVEEDLNLRPRAYQARALTT